MTQCDPQKRDRLSIHLENGEHNTEREAVTILRNGGTASQSGLVGITNATYDPTSAACEDGIKLPQTIFNVQSTGDSNIRFSSGPSKDYRSSLELLGVGNTRASGLHISYDPVFDDAYVDPDHGYYAPPCPEDNNSDNTVVDFSLIRPSGCEGYEFSHISMSERGYVSVGLTRAGTERLFNPVAPLTVRYDCYGHNDSGTIAMHEQPLTPPLHEDGYGKLYVKPYTVGGRSQALYFQDDDGNETNLVLSQDISAEISTDGLIYGNNGNTYGGWYTPEVRQADNDKTNNTYYGWGAGYHLSDAGYVNCNTLIGYHTGSGLKPERSNRNTVVGCESLTGWESGEDNVIIGSRNVTGGSNEGPSESIVIGFNLYEDDKPEDGTLTIGRGSTPLVTAVFTGSDREFALSDARFEIADADEYTYQFEHDYKSQGSKYVATHKFIDLLRDGNSSNARTILNYDFYNSEGAGYTLWSLNPNSTEMTNSPAYESPTTARPYAELCGDLRLCGAIRFADGTSLDSSSIFSALLPVEATTGIRKIDTATTQKIVLDYRSLELAGNVATSIDSDNTFIAVQVDGSDSSLVGKMSLDALSLYFGTGGGGGGGFTSENCNILLTNDDNVGDVNTAGMANSLFAGCNVATGAEGHNHAVMLGPQAGAESTVTNPNLATSYPNIFIGHKAGMRSNDVTHMVAIGEDAGYNADGGNYGIFIGQSAGRNSNYTRSIGLGYFALASQPSINEIGEGNLEIVTGLSDSQRLFYSTPNTSYRININNVIAGRHDRKNISIGTARLSPTAPLEVRRTSLDHDVNNNDYIQSWYCDDTLKAWVDCEGNFNTVGDGPLSENIEGLVEADDNDLTLAAGINVPQSGKLAIYEDGVLTGQKIYITNRDANLSIGATTYVVASRVGSEYRPVWVSC